MTVTTPTPPLLVDPLESLLGEHLDETEAFLDPLARTAVEVELRRGLATVTLTRTFRNEEERPLEVLLTWPAPSAAVLFRLEAVVGGRRIVARAAPRAEASETYEGALGRGVAAVRHQELLPGIHLLSVGNLAPGAEVEVSGTWAQPLQVEEDTRRLRIPLTIGQVYGRSGLDEGIEPRTDGAPASADLRVRCESGSVRVEGAPAEPAAPDGRFRCSTDAPIDLEVTGAESGPLTGTAADGRTVTMAIEPVTGDGTVEVAVLVDRSRSMEEPWGGSGPRSENEDRQLTKWAALRTSLRRLEADLGPGDRLELWEFDSRARRVGSGPEGAGEFARAVQLLGPPRGGTEIGRALGTVRAGSAAPALLLITDGKSHALDTERFLSSGRRLVVILMGEDSLDSGLARLAVDSGGDFFIAGPDIGATLRAALSGLRTPGGPAQYRVAATHRRGAELFDHREILRRVLAVRGGARITAAWTARRPEPGNEDSRAVAALAAGLGLGFLPAADAARVAVEEGIASSRSDLLLVDEAGGRQVPWDLRQRRAALPAPRTATGEPGASREPLRARGTAVDRAEPRRPRRGAGTRRREFGVWPSQREVPTEPDRRRSESVESIVESFASRLETPTEIDRSLETVQEARARPVEVLTGPDRRTQVALSLSVAPDPPFGGASAALDQLRRDAYFPVREDPLHLPDGRPVSTHRALVEDRPNGSILSVVSGGFRRLRPPRSLFGDAEHLARLAGGYHLVTNEEAGEAGRRVFALVFGENAARELRPINLTMPSTRRFMHADFSADSLDFALWGNDAWTPFLRVTNSYNRTHQLRFTVGVHRLICANGMIGEDGVTFSDPHRHPLAAWMDDIEKHGETRYGLRRFDPRPVRERLERLAEVPVPADHFLAGLVRTLELKPPEALARLDQAPREERKRLARRAPAPYWGSVGRHLEGLAAKYRESHGDTAFALLGAASEYASRERAPGMHAGRVNALQRRCGGFAKALGRPRSRFEVNETQLAAARRIEIAIEYGAATNGHLRFREED